jgi:hypothetical protein
MKTSTLSEFDQICPRRDRTTESAKDSFFFGLPSIVYVLFLYLSYDVEWLLLPLSKFWESDPEWAQKTSFEMVPQLRSRKAKKIVQHCTELTVRSSVFPVCPQYAPILFRFQSAILRFLRFPEAFVTERAACKTVLQDATCIQETYRQRQAARLYLTLYLTMNLQDVADAIALQSLDRGLDE